LFDRSLVFISIWNQIFPGRYTVRWHEFSSKKGGGYGTFTYTVKSGGSELGGIGKSELNGIESNPSKSPTQ
jgi:hypothetical protein